MNLNKTKYENAFKNLKESLIWARVLRYPELEIFLFWNISK